MGMRKFNKKEYNKQYYLNNKENAKQYYLNNSESIKEYLKQYRKENSELCLQSTEWGRLKLKMFKTYTAECPRCTSKKNIEVDHFKPVSKYPELKLEFTNLQFLCRSCNREKGNKDDPRWDFRNRMKKIYLN